MTDILKDVEDVAAAGLDIRTKLVIGMSVVLALAGAAVYGAHYFEERGATIERASWLAKQVQEQAADAALIKQHQQDMNDLEKKHLLIERQTSEDHENELAQLRRERDADRVAVDAAGGLRIAVSSMRLAAAATCPSGSTVAGTEAAGAGGRDEAGATTVRLPQPVEDGLWRLADDADEVSAQLRACQSWISKNGFYGPENAESAVNQDLLDRITSAKNPEGVAP